MTFMFGFARNFNQAITNWDVSTVTNMRLMLADTNFNQALTGWDVSSVTDMSHMFRRSRYFDHDLSGWNVALVTDMQHMFDSATAFNQDITGWTLKDTSVIVTDMFTGATAWLGAYTNCGRNGGDAVVCTETPYEPSAAATDGPPKAWQINPPPSPPPPSPPPPSPPPPSPPPPSPPPPSPPVCYIWERHTQKCYPPLLGDPPAQLHFCAWKCGEGLGST